MYQVCSILRFQNIRLIMYVIIILVDSQKCFFTITTTIKT